MINVSNEWKSAILEQRQFYAGVKITFEDLTVLNLDNSHIRGIKIEDNVSNGNTFTLGNAIINKLSLQIDNTLGEYDVYDFTNAEIRPSIGLQLTDTAEYIHKGVYIVDTAVAAGYTITITALDYMSLLDYNYSGSTLNYPATLLQIMQEICTRHGITFQNSSFTNSNMIVDKRPNDEALTDREMTAYCAQCSGNQARFDNEGRLEFIWYDIAAFEQSDNLDGGEFDSSTPYASGDNADGGNFTDYNSGDNYDGGTFIQMNRYHHIYSLKDKNIAVDDVVITGIQVTDTTENKNTYMYGLSGYIVSVSDNPLIQTADKAQLIANTIGAKIVGMRFRPLSITAVSDPSREAGDVAYVSDFKGNSYQTFITSINFGIGSLDAIRCDAETPSRNTSKRYSATTKAIVESRNIAKQEVSAYDIAVQQLTNLMVNSFGAFKSEEKLEDGSTVFYMHNKPTRAASQTIWKMTADAFAVSTDGGHTWNAGMDSNGNAVVNVLSAIGVNAEWIKVLTSFTVGNNFSVNSAGILHATNAILSGQVNATSGQIGPFTLDNRGLFGQLIEIYEQSNYPFMWFTKPGDSGWGSNNSQRANIEPALVVVREKKDGVETDTSIYARDDGTGTRGKVQISKYDSSGNISKTTLKDGAVQYEKWESGLLKEGFDLNHDGLTVNIDGTLKSIFFQDDDIYIDGVGWRATLNRIAALEAGT
ncbi:MAG: hypothetical protein K0R92_408 [Lachnospiraceae bacterium]|jgi:hypothetical protein|nr:hypothetical protein [Lachnospiraceae bacterium]